MAYDWAAYLKMADQLASRQHSALKRTAVSRAYYATFNLCRDWIEAHGVTIPNTGAHKAVWDAYGTGTGVDPASTADAAAISGYGRWLSKRRNWCDYDDAVTDLDKVTRGALKRAHLVVDDLLPRLK